VGFGICMCKGHALHPPPPRIRTLDRRPSRISANGMFVMQGCWRGSSFGLVAELVGGLKICDPVPTGVSLGKIALLGKCFETKQKNPVRTPPGNMKKPLPCVYGWPSGKSRALRALLVRVGGSAHKSSTPSTSNNLGWRK
jgi:hypothetical protein